MEIFAGEILSIGNSKGNGAGKQYLQMLVETAETIAEQSKEIRASVEGIIK